MLIKHIDDTQYFSIGASTAKNGATFTLISPKFKKGKTLAQWTWLGQETSHTPEEAVEPIFKGYWDFILYTPATEEEFLAKGEVEINNDTEFLFICFAWSIDRFCEHLLNVSKTTGLALPKAPKDKSFFVW